jgi:hypothetical protein
MKFLPSFAPLMISVSATLGENTWHLNLEQEIRENQRARAREGESDVMGEDTPQTPWH